MEIGNESMKRKYVSLKILANHSDFLSQYQLWVQEGLVKLWNFSSGQQLDTQEYQ